MNGGSSGMAGSGGTLGGSGATEGDGATGGTGAGGGTGAVGDGTTQRFRDHRVGAGRQVGTVLLGRADGHQAHLAAPALGEIRELGPGLIRPSPHDVFAESALLIGPDARDARFRVHRVRCNAR